jgi:hypothetical protein
MLSEGRVATRLPAQDLGRAVAARAHVPAQAAVEVTPGARARRQCARSHRGAGRQQPFGEFAGTLPVAGELRCGWGVMERFRVPW